MKPMTAEWVAKAEGDFATSCRELRAQPTPNFDAACFHAQQSAEKFLKARLIEAGRDFPKTHDLPILLGLLLPIEPSWDSLRDDLDALTDLAVEVRYPGFSADADDASRAVDVARKVRSVVRAGLRLGE